MKLCDSLARKALPCPCDPMCGTIDRGLPELNLCYPCTRRPAVSAAIREALELAAKAECRHCAAGDVPTPRERDMWRHRLNFGCNASGIHDLLQRNEPESDSGE